MRNAVGPTWPRRSPTSQTSSLSTLIIRFWCSSSRGAYDTDGQEQRARALYERALDLGLAGDPLRRCLCQYGSTLRWLGHLDESLAVLERARHEFPDSDAVRVFLALTLNEVDRGDAATGELLTVITSHGEVTDLGHWADGLRGLARWLSQGRPED